jgi:hypothetical protein
MKEQQVQVPPVFAATLVTLNAQAAEAQGRLDLAVAGMLAGLGLERAQVLAVDAQAGTVMLGVPDADDEG